MAFEDKTIVCVDCGQEFVHSAEDQQRYAERGFTNEPKRCRPCREAKKAAGAGSGSGGGSRSSYGGGAGGSGGGGGSGGRSAGTRNSGGSRSGYASRGSGPKQFYPAVCAECGRQTEVPFKPSGDRPVYCRDCYKSRRPSRV